MASLVIFLRCRRNKVPTGIYKTQDILPVYPDRVNVFYLTPRAVSNSRPQAQVFSHSRHAAARYTKKMNLPFSDKTTTKQAAERAFALGAFGAVSSYCAVALAHHPGDDARLRLHLLYLQSVPPEQRNARFSAGLDNAQALATELANPDGLLQVYLLRLEYLCSQNRWFELDILKLQIQRLIARMNDPLIEADILKRLDAVQSPHKPVA